MKWTMLWPYRSRLTAEILRVGGLENNFATISTHRVVCRGEPFRQQLGVQSGHAAAVAKTTLVTQSCRARQDAAAATETSSPTISASDSGFHRLALLKLAETGMTA
jgi:hypothetical protein